METSWSVEMMEETEVAMLKEHFAMSNSVSTSVKDSMRRQAEGKIHIKGKEDRATVEQVRCGGFVNCGCGRVWVLSISTRSDSHVYICHSGPGP